MAGDLSGEVEGFVREWLLPLYIQRGVVGPNFSWGSLSKMLSLEEIGMIDVQKLTSQR